MDLYRDLILDHYHNPRNFGHLEKPDVIIEDGNVSCGDKIVMEVIFSSQLSALSHQLKSKVAIQDVKFSGEGCAINQASASMLTEKVKGMTLDDVKKIGLPDILEMLGTTLTPSRVRCATLPLEVLHKAIAELYTRTTT